jgi:tRNA(fMet)-specific endonuclease VapC
VVGPAAGTAGPGLIAAAADIRTALERQGQVIGGYSLMIAGHARSRGLVVVTGNLGEFSRVAGLRSEDWLAGMGAG